MPTRPLTDLESARALIADLAALAQPRAIALRAPPPEPTTCCGRGCSGCVWERYFAAVAYWREEASEKISAAGGPLG